MIIEESIEINAPLAVVWKVFSRLDNWDEWNSVCQSCSLVQGEEMKAGVCFAFTLRPYDVPIKITPRITRCVPGREVVWEGGRLGVRARHRFSFQEAGDGVRVVSHEEFVGPLLWLSWLFLIPLKLHELSKQLLREIKAHSERCAVSGPVAGEGED